MTEKQRAILEEAGMDVDKALMQLMNKEEMVERFIIRFLSDESYPNLLVAIENKQWDVAFRSVHTLKGLAANFGFMDLYDVAVDQTEAFRANKVEEGVQLLPPVTLQYERITKAIREAYEQ